MDEYLYPGERVLEEQAANLLLGLDLTENFGTPQGRAAALLITARALAKAIEGEAIGGRLYLTNYRFFFASHGLNWTKGSYGIFLPTVGEPRETDGLLSDQLTIPSNANVHRFVVRKAKLFTGILSELRAETPAYREAPPKTREQLRAIVEADVAKIGEGVAAKWPGTSLSTEMIQLIGQSVEAKETDAIQALAIVSALELFLD
jgi:hypothetical protein